MLWRTLTNAIIEKTLTLKRSVVLKATNSNGTVNVINLVDRIVNHTAATLTLSQALHDGKTVTVNKADGSAITLPAATGSGTKFRLLIGTTITSVGTTIKVVGDDTMVGFALLAQDAADTSVLFGAAGTDDTITLNGTTTGGTKGDIIELEDMAADLWSVRVTATATGTEATPFSATVS